MTKPTPTKPKPTPAKRPPTITKQQSLNPITGKPADHGRIPQATDAPVPAAVGQLAADTKDIVRLGRVEE